MYTLRPHQVQVNSLTRQAVAEGRRRILIVMPTGSGKTVVFSDVAAGAAARGNSVLTIVHRQEILQQTLEKYHAAGVVAGQVASGRIQTKNPIQVAMIQTLVNRLDSVGQPEIIIIDEGHHAAANIWQQVLAYFPDAIVLFYTATPERNDGRGMGDICDCIIRGADILELVADGYLVMPMIKTPGREFTEQFHLTRGDFDKKEQAAYMTRNTIVGDVIDYHRTYLRHKPTISFVANLAHGAQMERIYRDAGITAKMIQGGQKYMPERKRACRELADGTTEILISCDVISEGFDVPVCAGCHLLRRTMSLSLYLQQAGRTLRPIYADGYCLDTKPGRLAAIAAGPKPASHILDFAGNFWLHGHVMDRREWNLFSTRRDPRKTTPNITVCPRCHGVWPGKPHVCPGILIATGQRCGYIFAEAKKSNADSRIQQIAGQLVDAIPGLDQEFLQQCAEVFSCGDKARIQKWMMARAFEAVKTDNRKILEDFSRLAGYKGSWIDFAWHYAQKKMKKK